MRGIILAAFCVCGLAATGQNTKLQFVQIVFRHGERAPLRTYPTDPHRNHVWKEGPENLTKRGKKELYELGKYFRSLYDDFMTTDPKEVLVNSTEKIRAMQSAQSFLASFFSPTPEWSFEASFPWQPIPVHYRPLKDDMALYVGSVCKRGFDEAIRISKNPEFLERHKETIAALTPLSGWDMTNWLHIILFQDTIFTQKAQNMSVPAWVEPYWEDICKAFDEIFYLIASDPIAKRLAASPLLKVIIQNMSKKINGDLPDLKFNVISGHDSNIALSLCAFDLYDIVTFKRPPYASALAFELHEMQNGAHAVRILYQNSTDVIKLQETHVLKIKGCDEFCPFESFLKYIKDVIPEDLEKECQKPVTERLSDGKNSSTSDYVPLLLAIVSFVLVVNVKKTVQ